MTYDVKEFMTNEKFQQWNPDEFMFDTSTLEFEKNCALWSFNSYGNYTDYDSMRVYSFDIDPRIYELVRVLHYSLFSLLYI